MTDKELRERVSSLCHTQWSGWMKYLFSLSVKNTDGTVTIPKGLVERWDRQVVTPYSKLKVSEKESDRKEADRFLRLILGTATAKPKPDPRVNILIETFKKYCLNIKNFVPETSYGVEGKMLKAKLQTYTQEDLEELFDWFLNNKMSTEIGCSLKTCLSNYAVNMWLKDRNKYEV